MTKAEIEAKKLQAEAAKLLNAMFKIPEGYGSDTTKRIVECIVLAATLNTMVWMADAARGQNDE